MVDLYRKMKDYYLLICVRLWILIDNFYSNINKIVKRVKGEK